MNEVERYGEYFLLLQNHTCSRREWRHRSHIRTDQRTIRTKLVLRTEHKAIQMAHFVTANLELGELSTGVPVCSPRDISERGIVDGLLSMNLQRNLKLKELMALSPVNLSVETDGRAR